MEQQPQPHAELLEELDSSSQEVLDKQRFVELFNRATLELRIDAKTLALALKDSIDPGVYTIDSWCRGEVFPSSDKHTIIFQTLGNIARWRAAEQSN